MKKTILNFVLVLGLSFLTLSCQKDEGSSATSLIVGVWNSTNNYSETINGVTYNYKDVCKLIINENNTFSSKWSLYIDNDPGYSESESIVGTYSYNEKQKYLTLNYTESNSNEVEIFEILSISNSEMKVRFESGNTRTWTK